MKNTESTGTSLNAENTINKNSFEIKEEVQLGETPFVARGNKEDGYIATLGAYRVTNERYSTIEELIEKTGLELVNWKFMTTVISIVAEQVLMEREATKVETAVEEMQETLKEMIK